MTIWQAVIMGIIQGLGEFLPISSSGHLILAPWLFNWEVHGLTFDIALHLGTLLAVIFYFWKDWIRLFQAALTGRDQENRKIFWFLVVASIPAVVVGLLFNDMIENVLRSPIIVGIMLIVFAVFLYLADRSQQIRRLDTMTLQDSLFIGIAQAIALIPGVSRSGITMTAARAFSFTREEAARFSFLLSTPVILGAAIMGMRNLTPGEVNLSFVTGILVSCIVGLFSISVLLKILKRYSFKVFVGYRIILGAIIIFLYAF